MGYGRKAGWVGDYWPGSPASHGSPGVEVQFLSQAQIQLVVGDDINPLAVGQTFVYASIYSAARCLVQEGVSSNDK